MSTNVFRAQTHLTEWYSLSDVRLLDKVQIVYGHSEKLFMLLDFICLFICSLATLLATQSI
jgi:hypothetical protein